MVKRATMTRVTALATTLSLALIGMPGGTAVAAQIAAELYVVMDNAIVSDGPDREEGGFGYVVVSKVRGDNVWYVKVENVGKETYYTFINDNELSAGTPCLSDPLASFKTDTEGDALVTFAEPELNGYWVHVCRYDYEWNIKILTGKLQKLQKLQKGKGKP